MSLFRRFIILSPACSHLVKPWMISSKLPKSDAESNSFSHVDCTINKYYQMRYLASRVTDPIDPSDIAKNAPKRERAKTPEAPKINLLDSNGIVSVCTKEEAEKIATSKKLRLVQVIDPKMKTQRPAFKLMSEAEYLEEELREKRRIKEEKKKNPFVKGDKVLTISTRSTDHDIEIKLNRSLKWLEKRFEIRVIILGSATNTAPQEAIYQKFEKTFKDIGRIVQKRMKNGDLKFQIIPPKREDEIEQDEEERCEEMTHKEEGGDETLQVVKKSL